MIITDITKPINITDIPDGTITLHELKIWPGWTFPKFDTIFSYSIGDDDYDVKVEKGKLYTFHDLQMLLNKYLNVDDQQVTMLDHNNGGVTWRLFKSLKNHQGYPKH